jgi:hypothetical protein
VKIAEADVLFVPGLGGAPADHWQARWVDRLSTARLIEQAEWDAPALEDWVDTIAHEIMMATRPVVLVGHALGVAAIVHTAQRLADTKVRGAFLVACPDIEENRDVPRETAPFAPMPREPLPFPSILVASATDPYCSLERAAEFASAWGSDFRDAGNAGGINVESGHGAWPEGSLVFARLMKRLK